MRWLPKGSEAVRRQIGGAGRRTGRAWGWDFGLSPSRGVDHSGEVAGRALAVADRAGLLGHKEPAMCSGQVGGLVEAGHVRASRLGRELDLDCPDFLADSQHEVDLSTGCSPQMPCLIVTPDLAQRRQELIHDMTFPARPHCRERSDVAVDAQAQQAVEQPAVSPIQLRSLGELLERIGTVSGNAADQKSAFEVVEICVDGVVRQPQSTPPSG